MTHRLRVAIIASLVTAPFWLYFGAVVVLGLIPENARFHSDPNGVLVYLRSNGVHIDLVLPRSAFAGSDIGQLQSEIQSDAPLPDLAFGWGDRAFYIQTPTWSDLKLGVALGALSARNPSVLHVEAAGSPSVSDDVRTIRLRDDQLARLTAYVGRSFARDALGKLQRIPGAGYQSDDAFYEANGHYSAFSTCNEWVRRGLAAAGVRVPVWSPFEGPILGQLEPP